MRRLSSVWLLRRDGGTAADALGDASWTCVPSRRGKRFAPRATGCPRDRLVALVSFRRAGSGLGATRRSPERVNRLRQRRPRHPARVHRPRRSPVRRARSSRPPRQRRLPGPVLADEDRRLCGPVVPPGLPVEKATWPLGSRDRLWSVPPSSALAQRLSHDRRGDCVHRSLAVPSLLGRRAAEKVAAKGPSRRHTPSVGWTNGSAALLDGRPPGGGSGAAAPSRLLVDRAEVLAHGAFGDAEPTGDPHVRPASSGQ